MVIIIINKAETLNDQLSCQPRCGQPPQCLATKLRGDKWKISGAAFNYFPSLLLSVIVGKKIIEDSLLQLLISQLYDCFNMKCRLRTCLQILNIPFNAVSCQQSSWCIRFVKIMMIRRYIRKIRFVYWRHTDNKIQNLSTLNNKNKQVHCTHNNQESREPINFWDTKQCFISFIVTKTLHKVI